MGKHRLNLAFTDKNPVHEKVYRALVSQGRHKTDFVCRAVLEYLGEGGKISEERLTTALEGVLKNLLSRYEFRPRENHLVEGELEIGLDSTSLDVENPAPDITDEDAELIQEMLQYTKAFG